MFKQSRHFFSGIFLVLILLFLFAGRFDGQKVKSRISLSQQMKNIPYSGKTIETDFSGDGGQLKWKFYAGSGITDMSSPAIGLDGTIYFCCSKLSHYVLFALNQDGTKKWEFQTICQYSGGSPCIGTDGTIYFGSSDTNFYAINPDGSLKWKFNTGGWITSSPAIALDGTIYFTSEKGDLYAIKPDGSLKWKSNIGGDVSSIFSIGKDGTIYLGSYKAYLGDYRYKLYALIHEGIKIWEFETGGRVNCSPAIDSDGNLYFGSSDTNFYAINPDGKMKWALSFVEELFHVTRSYSKNPAIGPEGAIYFGFSFLHFRTRDHYFRFWALNPDGTLKWRFNLGDEVVSSPAIGSDGTIYFGCNNGKFYALNPDGSLRWEFTTGDKIESSPAIASDGTIYFGSNDGYFYALRTDSAGLFDSPWPKFQHDNLNTGSVQTSDYYGLSGELEEPDTPRMYYDYADEIEVSGWALSLAGISKVEIYINDIFQGEASLGIARDDIYQRFPEYENTHSGFKWLWNIQSVPKGKYIIEAVAFNALGMKGSLGKKEAVVFRW